MRRLGDDEFCCRVTVRSTSPAAVLPSGGGPTGNRVAENLRSLRKARGLDLADLSARLKKVGQPMGINVLSKMELGQRRVDVDDLVALAVALDVSPNRLLLPVTANRNTEFALTPNADTTKAAAWSWATGDRELPVDIWRADDFHGLDLGRRMRFEEENRPHDPPDRTPLREFFERQERLDPVIQAMIQAKDDTGFSYKTIISALKSGLPWLESRQGMGRIVQAHLEGGDGERSPKD